MEQGLQHIQQLNELIQGIEVAMLTTVRPDGSLHSCPMATRQVDPDGILWFFTAINTEKVEALRTDQRVNLAYSDPSGQRYISISGFCELVRDTRRVEQFRNNRDQRWLPESRENPDLILLKVHVRDAEYWDANTCRMVRVSGFDEMPVAGQRLHRERHEREQAS